MATSRSKPVGTAILPPTEQLGADYPMVLTTGRQFEHRPTRAMTRRSEVLDTIEPEAVSALNVRDLALLGASPLVEGRTDLLLTTHWLHSTG